MHFWSHDCPASAGLFFAAVARGTFASRCDFTATNGKKLELKLNTLQKAIRAGRIRMPAKKRARWIAFSREHQKRAR